MKAKREDLIGKPIWTVLPGLEKTAGQFKKAAADRAPLAFETGYPGIDGKLRVQVFPSEEGLTVCLQRIVGVGKGD